MPTIQIKITDGKSRTKKVKYHNPLKQAILTTLSFFDLLKIPLKLEEIQRFLFRTAASKQDIAIMLKRMGSEKIVKESQEYFYLEPQAIIAQRKRLKIKEKLLLKAKKAKNILQFIPFVRTVAIRNSLAFGNVKKNSDIDLLIITKTNRLYLTRILSVIALKLFNLYQNKIDEPQKISLGFFMDEKGLNLEKIRLDQGDLHQTFWLACIKPIFGFKYYWRLMQKNLWLKQELPNFYPKRGGLKKRKKLQKFFEFLLPTFLVEGLEYFARRLQQKRIASLPENSWPTSATLTQKHLLKLHALDNRASFNQKLKERLKENLKTI